MMEKNPRQHAPMVPKDHQQHAAMLVMLKDTLRFYDGLDRLHDDGEAELLDRISSVIAAVEGNNDCFNPHGSGPVPIEPREG